eukprot:COSAG02_NODE_513_length_20826_cov_323.015246_14_plen_69_part_00
MVLQRFGVPETAPFSESPPWLALRTLHVLLGGGETTKTAQSLSARHAAQHAAFVECGIVFSVMLFTTL